MPQVRASLCLVALCLAGALALSGCGDQNSKAVLGSDTGRHPAGWVPSGHKAAAAADASSCTECHGAGLDGGISKVACSNCHVENAFDVHPVSWGDQDFLRHAAYVEANGTAKCANALCHGTGLAGNGAIPSCSACHLGGPASVHTADWTVGDANGAFPSASLHGDFVTAGGGYDTSRCANIRCHGANLKGVTSSGPSCFACHPADPSDPASPPAKHPPRYAAVWLAGPRDNPGFHATYLQTVLNFDTTSCTTVFCHGPGGRGPSCSTVGCHS